MQRVAALNVLGRSVNSIKSTSNEWREMGSVSVVSTSHLASLDCLESSWSLLDWSVETSWCLFPEHMWWKGERAVSNEAERSIIQDIVTAVIVTRREDIYIWQVSIFCSTLRRIHNLEIILLVNHFGEMLPRVRRFQ